MDYHNKVAFITGGSSGIGLAFASTLAARGANVWVMARHQDALQSALATIEGSRQNPEQKFGAVVGDVTDLGQVSAAVGKVIQAAGVPDLLINSAGAAHPGYVQDLDVEIFRWMMEVNYFGTIYVIKALLPGMLQRKSGHIVNISSVAGFLGVFGYTAYGASKFAITGFSDVLRAELKPHGIRVSVVFPPDTDTPQLKYENQFKPPETKAIAGNVKLMSSEAVARMSLKDIERGRYLILPGMETKLIHRLSGIVGGGVYPVMDYLIAQNHDGKGNSHPT